jgi:hypothetical protein
MRTTVQLAQEVGTRLGRGALLLRCVPLAGIALLVAAAAQPRTPSAAVDDLLAADRAFAAASARTTLIAGLTAMMAADVIMPVPGRAFADGVDAVRAELARDTLNAASRAEWAPVRGGISADGLHGFTFGYLTVHRANGTVVPGKYLAYWVKGTDGWRVAGYKRARRPDGAIDTTLLAPALPAALQAPARDATVIAAHRASVIQAERDFAGEAQVIGLRAAFAKYGSADAMNIGGPTNAGFVLGNEAIATSVSQGSPEGPSPVNWGADRALVASSGDLGVTFGFIEPNDAPAAGQPKPRFPFFTVWRRAAPGAPWRYVAE